MSVMDPHIRVLRAEAKAIAITLQAIAEGKLPGMPSTYETLYALRRR